MDHAGMIALVGNPNAGKSALFNALTGARQKVGNYPGVTVERKAGAAGRSRTGAMSTSSICPGTYSLDPKSPDETVTPQCRLRLSGRRTPAGHAGHRRRCGQSGQSPAVRARADRAWPALRRRTQHGRSRHPRTDWSWTRRASPRIWACRLSPRWQCDGAVSTICARRSRRRSRRMACKSRSMSRLSRSTRRGCAARPQRIARRAIVSETPSRRLTGAIDKAVLHPVARAADPARAAVRHLPGGIHLVGRAGRGPLKTCSPRCRGWSKPPCPTASCAISSFRA